MLYWNNRSRNILSAFWLRPYSALIRIIEESIIDISDKDTSSLGESDHIAPDCIKTSALLFSIVQMLLLTAHFLTTLTALVRKVPKLSNPLV